MLDTAEAPNERDIHLGTQFHNLIATTKMIAGVNSA
jgi:hypothetical protein